MNRDICPLGSECPAEQFIYEAAKAILAKVPKPKAPGLSGHNEDRADAIMAEDRARTVDEILSAKETDQAAEIAFWKGRAIWWCAYAENGLRSQPDATDLKRAERIVEQERK